MGITAVDNSVDNVENFWTVEKLSTVKRRFSSMARVLTAFFVDNSVDNGDKAASNAPWANACSLCSICGKSGKTRESAVHEKCICSMKRKTREKMVWITRWKIVFRKMSYFCDLTAFSSPPGA